MLPALRPTARLLNVYGRNEWPSASGYRLLACMSRRWQSDASGNRPPMCGLAIATPPCHQKYVCPFALMQKDQKIPVSGHGAGKAGPTTPDASLRARRELRRSGLSTSQQSFAATRSLKFSPSRALCSASSTALWLRPFFCGSRIPGAGKSGMRRKSVRVGSMVGVGPLETTVPTLPSRAA
jgi:hypothetical protein